MTKQIRLAALAAVFSGFAYLATPAHAAEELASCNLGTMLAISDAVCDGGSYTITDIESGPDSCSWTVTCH